MTPTYPAGQGLGYDAFRNEFSIGKYGYNGVAPASSSGAYAFYSTRTGVVDYSFPLNASSRQRMIFGYGASPATRDKFVVDYNAPANREDHYMDGAVTLRIKANAVSSGQDNLASCGESGARFTTVYAATGNINTSDAREKTAPLPIDDAVLDAWADVELITFQWIASIKDKGEDVARWHFGVIAQQVRDAFVARGLDGTRYGLLCYDEWKDEFEPVIEEWTEEIWVDPPRGGDKVKEVISHSRETGEMRLVREAGNRWGIRSDQCLFVEAAYHRREVSRQKMLNQQVLARLDKLEEA